MNTIRRLSFELSLDFEAQNTTIVKGSKLGILISSDISIVYETMGQAILWEIQNLNKNCNNLNRISRKLGENQFASSLANETIFLDVVVFSTEYAQFWIGNFKI